MVGKLLPKLGFFSLSSSSLLDSFFVARNKLVFAQVFPTYIVCVIWVIFRVVSKANDRRIALSYCFLLYYNGSLHSCITLALTFLVYNRCRLRTYSENRQATRKLKNLPTDRPLPPIIYKIITNISIHYIISRRVYRE